MSDRLQVRKTYKLYMGGKFPRSESGRTYLVTSPKGMPLANASWASRKDVRDAVAAARKAQPGWANANAYLRGQILYRIAEMLEGRREQFADEVAAATGWSKKNAAASVEAAVDRLVHYAGWTDKVTQVFGGANPVNGSFFNHTTAGPTGVVGIIAPQDDPLLGLVSVVAPAIATGNTVVVVSSYERPLPAMSFGEVLATSDVPGAVVNLLSGKASELAPWLASHGDVNAVDLTGVEDKDVLKAAEEAAADTLKRVVRPGKEDFAAAPGTHRLRAFIEYKTVWHPAGT
ncbi:aldehyde dehydrogenase family protein [Natronoglycomyces albus]|uniref:Aldehyde dehydrogenase family protein n=1 Tax=Natronoglycomyces albus TaxID=2811108 RepID=A0A895XRE4_9ACTN|nr:aldehyde dehydrogenase family protein [Natronoglycomyces albus]QSB05745.1 aldehyde dehydrogenase family protein [Natronoglycomyces albus]